MSNKPRPPELDPAQSYVGLRIADVFTIDALVATGASAHVFRATQTELQRAVAIKVMHRHLVASREMRARFHREARVASRIVHPAVVPVLMTGELPETPPTQGEAFIVYEFITGRTLRSVIEAERLTLPQIMGILIAAAEAVGSAHEVGIVHRDLKPENLMLVKGAVSSACLRVLDFGLARLVEPTEIPLTHTGAVLGTPNYLSPEGACGQPATAQSDVYSLAIIGYECLTGRPPFVDVSPIGVLMQHIERVPAPIAPLPNIGNVPSLIANAIMANLDKSPDRRAVNACHFAEVLRDAAARSQVTLESCELATDLWQTGLGLKPSSTPETTTPNSNVGRRSS
jgi:serine/threonine-protein kinase